MEYFAENAATTAAGAIQDDAQNRARPKYTGIVTGTYNLCPWAFMLQGD